MGESPNVTQKEFERTVRGFERTIEIGFQSLHSRLDGFDQRLEGIDGRLNRHEAELWRASERLAAAPAPSTATCPPAGRSEAITLKIPITTKTVLTVLIAAGIVLAAAFKGSSLVALLTDP